MAAAAAGLTLLALALVLVAGGDAVAARHSFRLASRNRVGAESEARVRHTLSALAGDGWNVRHGVNWQRRGDLDHALLAPTGVGFVIETKTLRYTREHVLRTVNASRWLSPRRRRYRRGVVPVLCVARARGLEHVHDGVLIVSPDRLLHALRAEATNDPTATCIGSVDVERATWKSSASLLLVRWPVRCSATRCASWRRLPGACRRAARLLLLVNRTRMS